MLPDTINSSELKSKDKVKDIQQKLIDAGYNLNPEGRFSNNGADGFIGKITKQAIEDYNTYGESGKYTPYKDGQGLLGKCKEQQCSEFAQNEVFRNLKPNVSREQWNSLTGIYGDAWDIGKNIVEKGGKEVKPNEIKPGDVVTVYTHGISPYQDEADAAGSGTTHTGIIDKVNPDGSYYVLHNLHKGNKDDGFEGREYRDLVKAGEIQGHSSPYTVKQVYRPNYNSVKEYEKKANIRQDTQITINDTNINKIKNQSSNPLKSSPFEDSVQNASKYIKPLNNVDNKKKLATKFGLDEDEYQSIVKSTLGILGQESKFGTATYLPAKQAVATASKVLNYVPTTVAANLLYKTATGKNLLKQDEVSKGAGQLKWEANNGNADLTEFGITEENFTEDKNIPIAMFNKIATNYKEISKTEKNKEKAIYKAIERYNRGKNTKYAEDFDSDYVNKVISFAKAFVVSDSNGKKFNTTLDKIALNRNITKRDIN